MFQHTAARRRLQIKQTKGTGNFKFQHTAARRRLRLGNEHDFNDFVVSTHSRAEAAAALAFKACADFCVSTHSRAEAAAFVSGFGCFVLWFQHTAARRRLLDFANPIAIA